MTRTHSPAGEFGIVLPRGGEMTALARQRLADYLEASVPGAGFTVVTGGKGVSTLHIVPPNVSDDDDIADGDRRSLPDVKAVAAIARLITIFIDGGGERPM